jgi:hypothetical protein
MTGRMEKWNNGKMGYCNVGGWKKGGMGDCFPIIPIFLFWEGKGGS